jgi:hypothetical protein
MKHSFNACSVAFALAPRQARQHSFLEVRLRRARRRTDAHIGLLQKRRPAQILRANTCVLAQARALRPVGKCVHAPAVGWLRA